MRTHNRSLTYNLLRKNSSIADKEQVYYVSHITGQNYEKKLFTSSF